MGVESGSGIVLNPVSSTRLFIITIASRKRYRSMVFLARERLMRSFCPSLLTLDKLSVGFWSRKEVEIWALYKLPFKCRELLLWESKLSR